MPTTSNFGWTTPADTDYVKDGALAIRTLGNGIDTSLVDLKGGTTGQILSKASNTDLDYTWINNDQGDITAVNAGTGISVTNPTGPTPTVAIDSTVATLTGSQTLTSKTIALGSNTVSGSLAEFNTALTDGDFATLAGSETLTNKTLTAPVISSISNTGTITVPTTTGTLALTSQVINNTLTTTTGDIIYASSANTPARLGIGSTNQVLTVVGGVPAWASPAAGASWTTWTPTFTNLTLGNGTVIARYLEDNKTVFFELQITFGTTTTISSNVLATLPKTPKNALNSYIMVELLDAGNALYVGFGEISSASTIDIGRLKTDNPTGEGGVMNATTPFTWGNTDRIGMRGFYEVS